jgi:hypothetical protein
MLHVAKHLQVWDLLLSCYTRRAAALSQFVYLLNQVRIKFRLYHCFHHSQVLEIVMCLKQSVAREELNQDTSY